MLKSEHIWKELESNGDSRGGLYYRRYAAEVLPDLFIGLKKPENHRLIFFRFDETLHISLRNLQKLKDIEVVCEPDQHQPGKKCLEVILLSRRHEEVFTVFAEDLILSVRNLQNEEEVFAAIENRFLKWQTLFLKSGREGLSEEKQKGLFGELAFLRHILNDAKDIASQDLMESWKGPEAADQDFQAANWLCEVKATSGSRHEKVKISSETQLEKPDSRDLFLYVFRLNKGTAEGQSLNDIITEIEEIVGDNIQALFLFRMKYMQYGYLPSDAQLYEENKFQVRDTFIFECEGDFPAITKEQLRPGLAEVSYSLMLSSLSKWRRTQEEFIEQLKTL